MNSQQTIMSRLVSWISFTIHWGVALMIAASIGGTWLLLAEESLVAFSLMAATLVLAASIGVLARQSRARVRRLKAALDVYAEREIARAAARFDSLHSKRRLASTTALDRL